MGKGKLGSWVKLRIFTLTYKGQFWSKDNVVKRMSVLKFHVKEIGKTTSKDEYVFSGLYEAENGCIGLSEVEIKNGPHTT